MNSVPSVALRHARLSERDASPFERLRDFARSVRATSARGGERRERGRVYLAEQELLDRAVVTLAPPTRYRVYPSRRIPRRRAAESRRMTSMPPMNALERPLLNTARDGL